MDGKFIVVEGLEGAGKSSAIALIKGLIEQRQHKVVCTREPGGTPMSEAIRACVKQEWPDEKVTLEAELLLMYAARVQLLENVIRPNLAQGNWVLGDRHDMSSRAYQGGGRQVPDDLFEPLRALALKGFEADFTLYLDVDPEEGLKRARGRGELDRIEQEDLGFFQRTRDKYLELAHASDRVTIVSSMQPIELVHRDITLAVQGFLDA